MSFNIHKNIGRRQFLTSAGITALALMPGVWSLSFDITDKRRFPFRRYRPGNTAAPVLCITPDDSDYIHTFYDVCPFSPSGRYVAVTGLPFVNRLPKFGDIADICIIDLREGIIKTVYRTKGWGFQLGANLNWGQSDKYLYSNDIINDQPVCVRIDIESGDIKAYSGPMYDIAPDESCVIGFPLDIINKTQRGYGVPAIPGVSNNLDPGAAENEGIWKTDLNSNKKKLLVSIADVASKVPDPDYYRGGTFYFFHSKFNKQNTRILQVLRCLLPGGKGGRNPQLFTFDTEGNDIRQGVTREQWARGANHPNWHPDGEHIIMNRTPTGNSMRFCQFKYDGSEFKILSDTKLGSGHPSVEPGGRYLISDAYPEEPIALENGEVPIRFIDLESDTEEPACYIYTLGPGRGALRLDPHPAWDRDYKKVCFNRAPEGRRQVFIADLSVLMK